MASLEQVKREIITDMKVRYKCPWNWTRDDVENAEVKYAEALQKYPLDVLKVMWPQAKQQWPAREKREWPPLDLLEELCEQTSGNSKKAWLYWWLQDNLEVAREIDGMAKSLQFGTEIKVKMAVYRWQKSQARSLTHFKDAMLKVMGEGTNITKARRVIEAAMEVAHV